MRMVFSEKENRYVELEYSTVDDKKVYNENVIAYDKDGAPIYYESQSDMVEKEIEKNTPGVEKNKTARERLNICNQCEYKGSFGRCSQCGCIIRLKVLWKNTECPKGKW